MKHRTLAGLALALVLLLALGLAGCGGKQKTTTIRIGVAIYRQDDTFISTVVQSLEQYAKEEEQSRNLKINLNIADGRNSQATQNEQVDRFLSQGYDIICVNLVDRTDAAATAASFAEIGAASDARGFDTLYEATGSIAAALSRASSTSERM